MDIPESQNSNLFGVSKSKPLFFKFNPDVNLPKNYSVWKSLTDQCGEELIQRKVKLLRKQQTDLEDMTEMLNKTELLDK